MRHVVFQRVDADADFSLDGLLAPIEDAVDDDRRTVITLAPTRARGDLADFVFEVHEAAPTPQRTRIFRCRYGTVLRAAKS
jgi:hypothetical protein